LYLPASWFHEVTSFNDNSRTDPDFSGHLAFNYWFHPPTTKDFGTPYESEYWVQWWKDTESLPLNLAENSEEGSEENEEDKSDNEEKEGNENEDNEESDNEEKEGRGGKRKRASDDKESEENPAKKKSKK